MGHDFERVSELISLLPASFDDAELARAIAALSGSGAGSAAMIASAEELSRWSYRLAFPDATELSERLLWPSAPPEYHGMEDARFTRFTDDNGEVTYFATYTAFDRANISQQLLQTSDFQHFASAPLAGPAAVGKGLALFPRLIEGRFAALTRCDWETNGIAFSDDARHWNASTPIHLPLESWEVIQVGNCGPPIEIDEGWLVLTHGVGPLRTYSIGALLLDLDDPTRVLARTHIPVIAPQPGQLDGYVPNVVYSCGALKCDDTLVIPYGVADESIEIATLSIRSLVASMQD
jgi:predicted GH43/DUF377 family glycosyl hydrolase